MESPVFSATPISSTASAILGSDESDKIEGTSRKGYKVEYEPFH